MNQQIELAFTKANKAINALEIAINSPMEANRINIDATIQRFEFAIELSWVLLKRILESKGENLIYPKDILRSAYKGNLINNETLWLQMLHDRNQTSHTYNEELANIIYNRIKQNYFHILEETYVNLYKTYAPVRK